MRSLAQPNVLARAALAGLLTALACLPWLTVAPKRIEPIWFAWLTLLWCVFMLWAFVFAWHTQYAHRPVFRAAFQPKLWAAATIYALVCAVFLHVLVDPAVRHVLPNEYPANTDAWLSMSLFALALQPLFVCFAPFAFFMRLARKPTVAIPLTVLFGLMVAYLRFSMMTTLPPAHVTAALLVMRVVGGFVSVYFYLNGGALLVWWVGLIVQTRLLLDLAAGH